MTAVLFKDVTTSGVHAQTALGNDKPPRRAKLKPVAMFSGLRKPDPGDAAPVDVFKATGALSFDKAAVIKIDESLGLVFGFAIVCKQLDKDYYDLQDDHIPEDAMLKASLDFMLNSRVAKEMHTGDEAGAVVFAFPLTTDIAAALEITTKQTGLLIAMRPAAGMLAKFKSGEFTGFSIGGRRLLDEEVATP